MHVFDDTEIAGLVESFCNRIPKLLAEHNVTADLLASVVGLGEQSQTPFTVAVVGQMRVGKSSLINAILEKDLAETGVTETTATINWIRFGDDSDQVRIHWKDKPPELVSRAELTAWTGDSTKAANTRYIELFDDAEFLKVASIVDTPGLRSVIGQHTDATEGFLGLKCEKETRVLGSQADAIVYVLMPVARETDPAFLAAFLNQTQLPGSASFNSIAVLHKWETLESDAPIVDCQGKAERIAAALGDSVSAVIPVSAPLAWATYRLPDSTWERIFDIGHGTGSEELKKMLVGERRFVREVSGCPVSVADRSNLLAAGLPWPSLRLIVTLAAEPEIESVRELQCRVAQVAQVDFLRSELDRRFFSRSRSLKILSTVAKAWVPCQHAQLRLRRRRSTVGEMLASSNAIQTLLSDRVQHGDDDLDVVLNYIQTTQDALQREHLSLTSVLKELSDEVTKLKSIHDDFVGDLAGLELLGSSELKSLSADQRRTLDSLFGGQGTTVWVRLAPLMRDTNEPLLCIEEAIEAFSELQRRSQGELRTMLSHAIARLEQLADHVESNLQEDAQ